LAASWFPITNVAISRALARSKCASGTSVGTIAAYAVSTSVSPVPSRKNTA
jgi:hypothetical protein